MPSQSLAFIFEKDPVLVCLTVFIIILHFIRIFFGNENKKVFTLILTASYGVITWLYFNGMFGTVSNNNSVQIMQLLPYCIIAICITIPSIYLFKTRFYPFNYIAIPIVLHNMIFLTSLSFEVAGLANVSI